MTHFEQLVAAYQPKNDIELANAQRETMQKVALAGMERGGFFEHAAFYGGTCLRLMHGLRRYSEDMDFSLTEKNDSIHIENYFQPIVDEFVSMGLQVDIQKKDKKIFGRVESAFLKENTEAYEIKFQTRKMMKVKIELDTNPPLAFHTERCLLTAPYAFSVRCFTLPDLYAGKMHALVYRAWQRRIKGRDWYDFEWYVRNGIALDWTHLQERIREFSGETISREQFMQELRNKLAAADIALVKQDVMGYVESPRELDFWSNDYFLQLADMIRFE